MRAINAISCSEVKQQKTHSCRCPVYSTPNKQVFSVGSSQYKISKQKPILNIHSKAFIDMLVIDRMGEENNTGFVYEQDNSPSLCVDNTGDPLDIEINKLVTLFNYNCEVMGDDMEEMQTSSLNDGYITTDDYTITTDNAPTISGITITNTESINEPHNVMFESPKAKKVKFDKPILSCYDPILKELDDKLITKNSKLAVPTI